MYTYIVNTTNTFQLRAFALLFGIGISFGIFSHADAARLYIDPKDGAYGPGDTFELALKLDNEGECINAVEGQLFFSQDAIRAVDISTGDSILSLWVELPTIFQDTGIISFVGGIPGGYCGKVPGDTGESNILARVFFRVPGFTVGAQKGPQDFADVGFTDQTKILLNDGAGTPAALTAEGARISILKVSQNPANAWSDAIRSDATSPESFLISLFRDPDQFDGKYVVIFSTSDKQSGIDHYEVMEADSFGFSPGTKEKAVWETATSPYILKDQDLKSIIRVKALDKAGNETVVEYIPEGFRENILSLIRRVGVKAAVLIGILGLIVLIFGVYIFIRVRMHKKRDHG